MKIAARLTLNFVALLALAPAGLPAPQNVALEQKALRVVKGVDPFLSGPPFTLDQTLKLVAGDAIPLRRRKDAIQSRGVDFSWSTETINKLKAAGAADDMLELIKTKAKPVAVVAVAPKPAPTGKLMLACAPAECDISINGALRGSTVAGTMELAGPPGRWVVDFGKKGYISHQSSVTVELDKMASASAKLEPDRSTQEAFGAALLRKMIEAVGGDEGVRQLASVQATGTATIWGKDGKSVRWALRMRNRPDRAMFQAKVAAAIYDVAFEGSEFKASKNLKGQDALDLPTDFGFIRDYQLAAVIERLQNPQYKISAARTEPTPGEEFTLFVEGGAEKISIGLDGDLRPLRVRIKTETGVGSTLITYADYMRGDKASYPKTMQIKPDGWQQGLDIRFDTVELDPKLKDGDYKLKARGFGNLWN